MKDEITKQKSKEKRRRLSKNSSEPTNLEPMPVFITSFEIAINERPFLQKFHVCSFCWLLLLGSDFILFSVHIFLTSFSNLS